MLSRKQAVLGTALLGSLVAFSVPFITKYTEIDWIAYMQEVEGPVLHQVFDYEKLQGQTGPLVYPAGFVYLFALLRLVTEEGRNIFRAQMIFSALHVLLLCIVLSSVYFLPEQEQQQKGAVPNWLLPLVALSRRAHSIFELRLFNDGTAMIFAYSALAMGMRNRWTLACILFSLGVSVKMNVLLMAPGLAVLLVQSCGVFGAAWRVGVCALIQLVLALPFLVVNARGYLMRSFDLGRVFLLEWTVNFKFLEESTFQSLGPALLACTLLVWLAFGHYRWSERGLFALVRDNLEWRACKPLPHVHVATVMLESNFIGICFARSLHYQFYAWYVHTLPFLVWRGWIGQNLPWPFSLALCLAIEYCFNVFPATPASSMLLQVCHAIILTSAWFSTKPSSSGAVARTTRAALEKQE